MKGYSPAGGFLTNLQSHADLLFHASGRSALAHDSVCAGNLFGAPITAIAGKRAPARTGRWPMAKQ